ncbi:MAG: ATP-binding protein, partial [Rhodothermales bacterium]
MLEAIKRLTPESLISNCDPQNLGFARTDEVTDGDPMVGQARAREALQFGLGLRGTGYNVFVLGSIETAANRVVQQLLETRAESDSVPSDWCYVFNFDIPDRPNLICLPPGRGTELQSDMKRFTAEAQTSLAAAFESEEYQTRTQGIREEFQREHDQALQELEKNARAKGIVLVRAPSGFAFMPLKGDEAMALDEIRKIGDEDRRRFESAIEELHKELLHILRQVPGRQRRMRQRIRELDEEIARYAVHDLLEELRSKYSGLEEMEKYLGDVERDVVSNLWGVLRPDSAMGETAPYPLLRSAERSLLVRYEVNPLVSNEKVAGAPVVVEDHPTMQNLIGRVEYRSEMGALVTDFTLIKRGSLHIANGGYL